MGAEIDLMVDYPKVKRDVAERGAVKTEEDRSIARKFGEEFFDGDRRHGYGGYYYNPRFWQPVVPTFQKHYGLTGDSSILDVGCGKGFMLHDFAELIPGIKVAGIDVSEYAIENAIEDMRAFVRVGNADQLEYPDNSFDLVVSINTVHNLALEECKQALREIQRVTKKDAFITVDSYRTQEQKKRMEMWNLTAVTFMRVDEWIALFEEVGYKGDYYWFIP
jgi:ubiquinone/menaquinone biosynthesis C-methylase UbiE